MVIVLTSYTLWKSTMKALPPSLSSNGSNGLIYWIDKKIRKYFGWREILLLDLKGKPEQFKFLFTNLICQRPRYRKKKRYTSIFESHFCQQWADGVIIYSLTHTDPEHVLYVKKIWILLVSVSHTYNHITNRVYFKKVYSKESQELNIIGAFKLLLLK